MKHFLFISSLRSGKIGRSSPAACLLAALLLIFSWVSLGSEVLELGITRSGSNAELTWTNAADVRLQTSQTLSGDWMDLPAASSPYSVPMTQPKEFFRLRRVSIIQSIEPAFLPATGGTLYIVGLNFTPNTTLLLNGVPAGTVTFVDSSHLTVVVGPLATGVYDVSLMNDGPSNVLAKALTVNATGTSDEAPPGMATTAVGEFRQSAVDLAIPAGIGPSFVLARTYRSRFGPANSPMGKGWDFSGNISVETSGNDVIIHDGAGRADKFFHQSGGTYTRREFFREGSMSGQTFTLTFADKSRWVFRPFNATSAPGKIAQRIDRNGNAMTYAYNTSGQLTTVTDALNRAVQFSYNTSGLLTSVTDFAGRAVTYTYDGNGNLATMTTPAVTGTPNGNDFPSGKTTTYTYTSGNTDENLNHNLATIIDPVGTVVVTNQYSSGTTPGALNYDHLVSSALGTNPPTMFSYEAQTPGPANRYATTKVHVNDPVGNVTTALFDSRNRLVQTRQLTGRAIPGVAVTSSANQPTGKLRSSDPAFFETTIAYNLDSLPVQITEPRGNSVAMVYAGDTNPTTPVRERGNLLTRTQTPAPGVPSDQAQRVESWEYLPGFGTMESPSVDQNQGTWSDDFGDSSGIDTCVTKHTDPRGNVTTSTYDANGNCLSIQPPGLATGHSFEYNAAGQLTAHSHPADANARRQRDTFSYYGSGAQQGYLQSAVADANGLALTTSYAYDAAGNCTNAVDPRGNDSQFVYNQLNELMQVKFPPGGGGVRKQEDYTYSSKFRTITEEDLPFPITWGGTGATTPESILVRKDVSNFDENGNPIGDGQLSTHYGYDAIGRLTSVTHEVSDASSTVTQYAYDANGQVTSVLSPLAVSGADAFNTVATSYDERGLPFQQTAAPGSTAQSTTQYAYDANANLAAISEGLEGTPRTTTVVEDGFAGSGSGSGAYMQKGKVKFFNTPKGFGFVKDEASGTDKVISIGGTGNGTADGYAASSVADNVVSIPLTFTRTAGVYYEVVVSSGGIENYVGLAYAPTQWNFITAGNNRPNYHILLSNEGFENYVGLAYAPTQWDFITAGNNKPIITDGGGTGTGTASGPSGSAAGLRAQHSGLWVEKLVSQNRNTISAPGRGDSTAMDNYGYVEHGSNTPRGSFGRDESPRPTGVLQASILGAASQRGILPNKFLVGVRVCNTHTSRPRSITDPMGNVTEFHYDASGNRTSTIRKGEVNDVPGSAGNVTLAEASFQYDALNRLTSRTNLLLDAGGNTTGSVTASAAFADNGTTTAVTDALGHVTTVAYDFAGRVSRVTDPKNNSVAYAYDANGNVTAVTKRLKSDLGNADLVLAQSFGYDNLNRPTSATDSAGNTVSSTYDSLGRVVKTTDARGIVSQYQYDGLGRLTRSGRDLTGNGSAFDAADIVTTNSYDANSRLIARTDPNGNTSGHTYDALNRITGSFDGDLGTTKCRYDVHGNVTGSTDANGTVTTYAYDALNRPVTKAITPGAGVATTTTFEQYSYDGLGRVIQANNNAAATSFTYDSLGRKLTETQNGRTVNRTYDAAGNLLTLAYPGGRQLGYTYDAANLCTGVSLLATTDGDTLGVLSTNHYIGGLTERVEKRNNTRTTYSYDGGAGAANEPGDSGWGQVSRVLTVNSSSSAVIDDSTYSFDAAQNQTGKMSSFPGKVVAKVYQYDAANRLTNTVVTTNAVPTANITYTLDKAGNRLNVTGDNHPGVYTLDNTLPEPADFQVNQYTTTPVGNFTYDKNGNRLSETSGSVLAKTYLYDYKNQLVSVLDGTTGFHIADYYYDALGRRIGKNVNPATGGNVTGYVYNDSDVIEERDGTGAVVATLSPTCSDIRYSLNALDYNCGDRVSRVNVGIQTVPMKNLGALMRKNGTNYWPHTDGAGSTVALTLDNGTVAERYAYADFGEPEFFNGSGASLSGSTVGNAYLFGGMQYDTESGFYSSPSSAPRAGPYLDPRTGSTLQRDVGDPGAALEKAGVGAEHIKYTAEMGQLHATRAGW